MFIEYRIFFSVMFKNFSHKIKQIGNIEYKYLKPYEEPVDCHRRVTTRGIKIIRVINANKFNFLTLNNNI